MNTVILLQSQPAPTVSAESRDRDSVPLEPAPGRHFLGGYWIAAAVVLVILLSVRYGWPRRRSRGQP